MKVKKEKKILCIYCKEDITELEKPIADWEKEWIEWVDSQFGEPANKILKYPIIINKIKSLLLSKEEKVKEEILDEVIDLVKIFPTGMFDSTPYLKELLKRLDTLKR